MNGPDIPLSFGGDFPFSARLCRPAGRPANPSAPGRFAWFGDYNLAEGPYNSGHVKTSALSSGCGTLFATRRKNSGDGLGCIGLRRRLGWRALDAVWTLRPRGPWPCNTSLRAGCEWALASCHHRRTHARPEVPGPADDLLMVPCSRPSSCATPKARAEPITKPTRLITIGHAVVPSYERAWWRSGTRLERDARRSRTS